MAKATTQKAATEKTKKKKPAATTKATATRKPAAKKPAKKPAARKPAAKKTAVRKAVVKKVATKKPAAPRTKAARVAVTAKNPATTVKARDRKVSARAGAGSAKKTVATGARRTKSAVLEVSPAVIDTSSAAEVAARLVVDGSGVTPVNPLGNLFDPLPVSPVKRGSSALRHVKASLHKPVAAQLESVFGPAPVAPETMRRFLRDGKAVRTQRVRGGTNVHVGQPTVPHRSVG